MYLELREGDGRGGRWRCSATVAEYLGRRGGLVYAYLDAGIA
jgi:hypothetical protein